MSYTLGAILKIFSPLCAKQHEVIFAHQTVIMRNILTRELKPLFLIDSLQQGFKNLSPINHCCVHFIASNLISNSKCSAFTFMALIGSCNSFPIRCLQGCPEVFECSTLVVAFRGGLKHDD